MWFYCGTSDLLIPEGPALTNQTSEEEELAHSGLLPSPSSSPPCPSPASWLPVSAVWSKRNKEPECDSVCECVRTDDPDQGRPTFRASLREAEIFDFF